MNALSVKRCNVERVLRGPLWLLLMVLPVSPAPLAQQDSVRDAVGVVLAERKVVLAAKMIGRVVTVNAREGEAVEAGAALVELDAAELNAMKASADSAEALARVEVDHQARVEGRMRRLFGSKTVSEDRLDDAVYALAAARARLRSAQAEVSRVEALLAEATVRAPFAGVITAKTVEIGQLTQPGEPLYVLEDHSRLRLQVRVKEQDIPHVRVGAPARVTIDALDDLELVATVSRVIPSGDPTTHAFVVEIELPPREGLFPGMFGKAEFTQS